MFYLNGRNVVSRIGARLRKIPCGRVGGKDKGQSHSEQNMKVCGVYWTRPDMLNMKERDGNINYTGFSGCACQSASVKAVSAENRSVQD